MKVGCNMLVYNFSFRMAQWLDRSRPEVDLTNVHIPRLWEELVLYKEFVRSPRLHDAPAVM
jgi:hypothetical protein